MALLPVAGFVACDDDDNENNNVTPSNVEKMEIVSTGASDCLGSPYDLARAMKINLPIATMSIMPKTKPLSWSSITLFATAHSFQQSVPTTTTIRKTLRLQSRYQVKTTSLIRSVVNASTATPL